MTNTRKTTTTTTTTTTRARGRKAATPTVPQLVGALAAQSAALLADPDAVSAGLVALAVTGSGHVAARNVTPAMARAATRNGGLWAGCYAASNAAPSAPVSRGGMWAMFTDRARAVADAATIAARGRNGRDVVRAGSVMVVPAYAVPATDRAAAVKLLRDAYAAWLA